MSEHFDLHPVVQPQQPMVHDKIAWRAWWAERGQPWRSEPEIATERQAELERRLLIVADVDLGVYPFRGMQLNRADIEWLLTRQKAGERTPASNRPPKGLDVRGAHLQHIDLRNLPLAGLLGEITPQEWLKHPDITEEQQVMAIVHLEGANLKGADLEKARLGWARLEKADLRHTHLEDASLVGTHLEGANLGGAHLERANLSGAHLEGAYLWRTHLERANLRRIYVQGAYLGDLFLANEDRVGPNLVDACWGDVNLALINWSQISVLGDEYEVRKKKKSRKIRKKALLYQCEEAVRANRQLAIALSMHGLSEEASRFAYRAQCLQRVVLRLQNRVGQYLFSWLLNLLAGYGHRPERSVIIYLLINSLFATTYAILGQTMVPHITVLAAIVLSISSFHGRGFFPGGVSMDTILPVLAALEGISGLFVEIAFITTFTQRYLK